MVPTAISHKNTSATSTVGRRGEYNCTDTLRASKHVRHRTSGQGKHNRLQRNRHIHRRSKTYLWTCFVYNFLRFHRHPVEAWQRVFQYQHLFHSFHKPSWKVLQNKDIKLLLKIKSLFFSNKLETKIITYNLKLKILHWR